MPRNINKKTWYKNIALWALFVAGISLVISGISLGISYSEYKLNKTSTLDSEIHSRLNVLDSEIERVSEYVNSFDGSAETKATYALSLKRVEELRSEAVSAWIDKRYEESYRLIVEANNIIKDITPPKPTNWWLLVVGLGIGIILVAITSGLIMMTRKETS